MSGFVNQFVDNFARANAPAGSLGNLWVDEANICGILNLQLKAISAVLGATARITGQTAIRPVAENIQDASVLLETGVLSSTFQSWVAIARYKDNQNFYYATFFTTAGGPGQVSLSRIVGGVVTVLKTANFNPVFTPGTNYELQLTAVGVSPTTLQATVRSSPGGTIVAQTTTTGGAMDSSAGLQTALGTGFAITYDTNPSTTFMGKLSVQNNSGILLTTDIAALWAENVAQTVHVTGVGTAWNGSTSFTYGGVAVGSTSVTSSTTATLTINPGASVRSAMLSDGTGSVVLSAVTPAISTSPTFLPAGTTENVLTVSGQGTTWNSTPPTWTIDSGATITDHSVVNDFTARVTISTPATGQKMTLTDTASGAACFVDSNFSLHPGDADFYFTEYNWLKTGSASIETIHPGAYVQTVFVGDKVYATFDVSKLVSGSVAAGSYPWIEYAIDGGAPQVFQLASSTGQMLLTVPTSLSVAAHTLQIWYLKQGASAINRWAYPSTNSVIIDSIITNGSFQAPALQPKKMLVFGDSISQGYTGDSTGTTLIQDSTKACWPGVAAGLSANASVVAVNGLGLTVGGDGGVVPLFTPGNDTQSSWDKFNSAFSRLVGGRFSPAPDHIFIVHGTNDKINGPGGVPVLDSVITAAATPFLAALRQAAPAAWIFLVVPPGQYSASALTTGFQNYQASAIDPKCVLIPLGNAIAVGMNSASFGSPTGTWTSPDGTHPRQVQNQIIQGAILQAVHLAINPVKRIYSVLPTH